MRVTLRKKKNGVKKEFMTRTHLIKINFSNKQTSTQMEHSKSLREERQNMTNGRDTYLWKRILQLLVIHFGMQSVNSKKKGKANCLLQMNIK